MGLIALLLLPGILLLLGGDAENEIENDVPLEGDNAFGEEQSFRGLAQFIESGQETELADGAVQDQGFVRTGQIVSEDLFGANAVYSIHTEDGMLSDTFESAVDAFEIENLRFPAGQAEPDRGDEEGVDWIDITQLTDDGELRPELTTFLNAASGGVTLTIPTGHLTTDEYGQGLEEWAELVMSEYGDVVDAFEIGNEYWYLMGESEYGAKANIAIKALSNGIDAAESEDADILVQMASTFAQSEFHSSVDDRGFTARVTDANQRIIDQLDITAKSELDGVVEHYYWNKDSDSFDDSSGEVNYIDLDLQVWEQNFDQELDFHVTEWNIKASNEETYGLKGVGVMAEMVENMVELGVDKGAVWTLVHNTTNDLGGPDDGIVETDDKNRVIETVRGAIFDLMSDALPGMELVKLDLAGIDNNMEVAAYEKAGEFVFYLANNSDAAESFDVDLSELLPNFEAATSVTVGYDKETSDGRLYSMAQRSMVDAESVIVDGENYYLNEHDVGATLTDSAYSSAVFNVTLNPYEVIQITAL